MLQRYLEHGVMAGTLAGLWYGALILVVANPLVDHLDAISAAGHPHDAPSVVSAATTALVSVGGGVLWGVLLGAVFGAAFYVFEPALPGKRIVKLIVLAAAGFLAVSVTPWLVLPPGIPGSSQPLSPVVRIGMYLGLIVVGVVLGGVTIYVYTTVVGRAGPIIAGVGGLVVLTAGIVSILVVSQPVDTVGDVPARLVWVFRGLVVFGQASVWCILALTYGWIHFHRPQDGSIDW